MKRIVCLCVILLCSISFAFAQGEDAGLKKTSTKKSVVRKKTVLLPFAKAEKAWIPFWRDFKKAVKNSDNNSFYGMIAENYDASGLYRNNEDCKNLTDNRKEFFCLLREQETNLANEFFWIFRKQTKVKKIEKVDGKVRRNIDYLNDAYWFAEFVYKQDGKWYLADSGSGGA